MTEKTYYQRNKEIILNRAKEYHETNKQVLSEKARSRYRELSEKEKDIKREYGRNRYKNMSEGNRQRLKVYKKIYRETNQSKKFMKKFFFTYYKNGKNLDF